MGIRGIVLLVDVVLFYWLLWYCSIGSRGIVRDMQKQSQLLLRPSEVQLGL